ncbi:hypothetical protein FKM82_026997 [Ascaphus truei]
MPEASRDPWVVPASVHGPPGGVCGCPWASRWCLWVSVGLQVVQVGVWGPSGGVRGCLGPSGGTKSGILCNKYTSPPTNTCYSNGQNN